MQLRFPSLATALRLARRVLVALVIGGALALGGYGVDWFAARPFRVRTSVPEHLDVASAASAWVPRQALALAQAPSPSAASKPQVPSHLTRTKNVLLIGLDKHPGVRRGGRTDTMIIAALDDGQRRAALISVPRDLYVNIDGHGMNRLNAVYGYAQLDKKDPLTELERVMSDTLGVPIAHSIGVDLGVFERVVDAVDGVSVVVPCPILDNFLDPRAPDGRRKLEVQPGLQHMDGPTAAMYVRTRHGRSDWTRSRRQQAVLSGLKHKLASLDGVLKLGDLLSVVQSSLVTNMSRFELLELAHSALLIEPQRLHGVVLGWRETKGFRTERNWSVLLPQKEAIAKRLDSAFTAHAPGVRETKLPCPPADIALRARRGTETASSAASKRKQADAVAP